MRTLLASLVLVLTAAFLAPAAPARAAAVDRAAVAALEGAARADSALRDLYAARQFAPLWFGTPDAGARRSAMLALLGREQRLAASPGTAVDRLTRAFGGGPPRSQIEAELGLTRATLAYLGRRAGGRPVRGDAAARAVAGLAGARIKGELDLALVELRLVERLGGWSPVRLRPAPSVLIPPLTPVRAELELALPPEERPRPEPDVPGLRRRLVQSYDLGVEHSAGEELNPPVIEAVRRFQARHGLLADGVVGARTVALLNQGVSAQIRQVELNLARAGMVPERTGFRRYVEVNVPAFDLKLVEGGRVTYRSRIIVGDQETPTPLFDDWMRYIELNPSWSVPRSIVKEILDKEAKEPGYMGAAGFVWRAAGETGAASRLVQRPGPENALGQLKFVFPNRHAVYIHDTPNRGLFSRTDRTLSHGCVRLERPMGLAVALLGNQGWDQARIEAALTTPATRRVRLDSPVPVFLDYRTATLDSDGRLQLWPDIYGLDAQGIVRFRGKGLPPEQEPPPPAPVQPPPRQETVAADEGSPPVPTPGGTVTPMGL